MKLSTRARCAMEALLCLVAYGDGKAMQLSEIAALVRVPKTYLERVFPRLRQVGILTVERGTRGGYRLGCDPATLTAATILRAVDGGVAPVICIREPTRCPSSLYESCGTRVLWRHITEAINETLESVSLADLYARYTRLREAV